MPAFFQTGPGSHSLLVILEPDEKHRAAGARKPLVIEWNCVAEGWAPLPSVFLTPATLGPVLFGRRPAVAGDCVQPPRFDTVTSGESAAVLR